jgi:hypothetical protein|nr:MAG TPA: hypothetical protein [Caudoviricetes sp.]
MKKQSEDKKNYTKQKIDTYVSIQDITRLKSICGEYGFKSIYQLLQYLVYCFLRVADPDNDITTEPLPIEIEEMFTNNAEWERRKHSKGSHEGMYINQKPDQRKIKTPDDLK